MVDAEVNVVDVTSQRDLTMAIQSYTGVRHESPQVIVLREQKPSWHASHGRIRTPALAAAVA